MDIRVLNYFVTIVQHKSITHAAQSLHVTQSTLSRQMKELEEELGVTLLIRGSREIQLTEQGQYLYNRALEILSLVEKTEQTIRLDDEVVGTISIGAAESQSLNLIAKTMKELADTFPKIQFSIFSGNADEVQEKLDAGLLDFGIIIGEVNTKKYNHYQLENHDKWGVLVPNNHPLATKNSVSYVEIFPYPLIVSAQSNIDHSIFAGLGDYHIIATYTLLYNASLLVEAGLGIAICLDGIVQTPSLTFVSFDVENPDKINLIWRRFSKQSKAANMFLHTLETIMLSSENNEQ